MHFIMGTVGYTAGDAVYLHAEISEAHKTGNLIARILWGIILVAFTGYAIYQSYLCYQSYANPSWTTDIHHDTEAYFPAVLICPIDRGAYLIDINTVTCQYLPNGLNVSEALPCSITPIDVHHGRFSKAKCIAANHFSNTTAIASPSQHSFLRVSFSTDQLHQIIPPPFAVILYVPGQDNSISSQVPTFIAVTKSSYWAVISTTGDEYLNGTTVYRFSTSVSSATELQPVVNVTFSFASFDNLFAEQYVDYDWITLVGQLGGAAALASASHMILMALFAKVRKYYYRYVLKKEIDDEGEERAELPETIAVVPASENSGDSGVVKDTKTADPTYDSSDTETATATMTIGSGVFGGSGQFNSGGLRGVTPRRAGGSGDPKTDTTAFTARKRKARVKRYSIVLVPQQLRNANIGVSGVMGPQQGGPGGRGPHIIQSYYGGAPPPSQPTGGERLPLLWEDEDDDVPHTQNIQQGGNNNNNNNNNHPRRYN